jgi:hypothetical protein
VIHPDRLRLRSSSRGRCQSQKDVYYNRLDSYQEGRLLDVIRLLKSRCYWKLVDDLTDYLRNYESLSLYHDEWPSRFCMYMMAAYIVNAVDAGKYLQLARPVDGSCPRVPYRAIFVRDRHELRPQPPFVFTSVEKLKERKSLFILTL